ncbi:hypothetical protein CAAU_0621 [Caloramator australicus RC3]|uniref:Uncharacterized protein n=1 Tax=Caloramator australicus RC3 TaxID=857293 RepID=I7LFR2_9CLOT|nr:hypothetical protein CAAU_0621 [Caloramator australicus RC3]
MKYIYENDSRDVLRSNQRNMPNSCSYCIYKAKPSTSQFSCNICHLKYLPKK